LAHLVLRVQPGNSETLFRRLCEKLIAESSKDSEREIASIALKTLIQEIKVSSVRTQFVEVVTPNLLVGLADSKKVRLLNAPSYFVPVVLSNVTTMAFSFGQDCMKLVPACLEILVESLLKFGECYTDVNRAAVRDALLPLLHESRTGLRKKALQGLGEIPRLSCVIYLLVLHQEQFDRYNLNFASIAYPGKTYLRLSESG
jgi:hypothetical protein